jgi:hypothetical protein
VRCRQGLYQIRGEVGTPYPSCDTVVRNYEWIIFFRAACCDYGAAAVDTISARRSQDKIVTWHFVD